MGANQSDHIQFVTTRWTLVLAFLDARLTRLFGVRQNLSFDVPLPVGCVSCSLQPSSTDAPPEHDGAWRTRGTKTCCIDRHGGAINSLFLDGSVRKVGLQELWALRWSL